MTEVDVSNIHKSVVIWADRVISKDALVHAESQIRNKIRKDLAKKIETDTTNQFEKLVAEVFGSFSDGRPWVHLLTFDVGPIDIRSNYNIEDDVYTFVAERFLVLRSKTNVELMKFIAVYR